jgi:hypothetical protein
MAATSISAGGEHSLFVDGYGSAYSSGACGLGWFGTMAGSNSSATLGKVGRPCQVVSQFLEAVAAGGAPTNAARLPMPSVRSVVGGYYHSFAITRAGKLYSWGCGNFGGTNDGQLGRGDLRESTDPAEVLLPGLGGGGCGCAGGSGADADLTGGSDGSSGPPPPPPRPQLELVADASAGFYHSAVLTTAGRVFTFGLNNYGQLGRGGLAPADLVPRPPGTAGCVGAPAIVCPLPPKFSSQNLIKQVALAKLRVSPRPRGQMPRPRGQMPRPRGQMPRPRGQMLYPMTFFSGSLGGGK